VIEVGPSPGVDVRHEVEDAMALSHTSARLHGDVVTRFDAERGVDLDVRIDHDHVAILRVRKSCTP
jgi:hypothetical protein